MHRGVQRPLSISKVLPWLAVRSSRNRAASAAPLVPASLAALLWRYAACTRPTPTVYVCVFVATSALHNFPEGLAVLLASQKSTAVGELCVGMGSVSRSTARLLCQPGHKQLCVCAWVAPAVHPERTCAIAYEQLLCYPLCCSVLTQHPYLQPSLKAAVCCVCMCVCIRPPPVQASAWRPPSLCTTCMWVICVCVRRCVRPFVH